MDNNINLNGVCLYTPKGAAREYAAVGCNFYRGCPFQCNYCFNRKGFASKVMGVDHAVLKETIVSKKYRPKKWLWVDDINYAMRVFIQEFKQHESYLRKTGIFLSFSTDPMLSDTFMLSIRVASFCAEHEVPVTILTKCVLPFLVHDQWFADPSLTGNGKFKEFVSFGFSLTGRDDQEMGAARWGASNADRIRVMKRLKELRYSTWASIEPIVDFSSSLSMVRQTAEFCDHYKIGLMSNRLANGFKPYVNKECRHFIENVCACLNGHHATVYWKESIRKLMADDSRAMGIINDSPISVDSDWSLFSPKYKDIQ